MQLDEVNGPVIEEGRDVNVIATKVPATIGAGSIIFEVCLWILIIPGIIWSYKKLKTKRYFDQLQQKIQQNASQIDNYLEQRVMILKNVAPLVEKAINLDKETFAQIAKFRAGGKDNSTARNEVQGQLDGITRQFNMVMESYPDLEAHKAIADAMQQNALLQREITAARELYNDSIARWNTEIFQWPLKNIVAARQKYTTMIPFSASKEIKEAARGTFF